ncbi:MAG: 5-(carboxyamino)imidazole ribonucleotide synthase, partial [Caldimonas sp.]
MPAEATPSPRFIAPGATLGVLGGGQLGRMFVHAAQAMGYRTAVLDPDPASPAGLVAHEHIRAPYLDPTALGRMADRCAAITTEFENVPAAALEALARRRPVAPAAAAVAVCQDRAAEKAAFVRSGVACAPYAAIATRGDLRRAGDALFPGVLKTARLGYDGKGQQPVPDRAALAAAFDALGGVSCVLEKRLPLAAEISVVVARNAAGDVVHLPVQDNVHAEGILAVTRVPPRPRGTATVAAEAIALAGRLAAALDYVGVLCVELFVLADGSLVANEMAPRPHNSGHHSIDSCDVSQFALQVRAMTGAPLVAPRPHSAAVMLNLLG